MVFYQKFMKGEVLNKMRRIKGWSYSEEKRLLDNYNVLTIKELKNLFPERSIESINNKIKRLKKSGKIKNGKLSETIQRSYFQRKKEI